jgi:hypothetical protein
MSETGDLFSLMGEEPSSAEETPKPKTTHKKIALTVELQDPIPENTLTLTPTVQDESPSLNSSFPVLESLDAVRTRCVELLSAADPALAEVVPAELPFPLEDDPFAKTAEEWEAVWYAARESAYRVYLNMRMEFRRQLSRALSGEPHDLKSWAYWVMNGKPPADGEPVHGLTEARRSELGWPYPGPPTDFTIYRQAPEAEGSPAA